MQPEPFDDNLRAEEWRLASSSSNFVADDESGLPPLDELTAMPHVEQGPPQRAISIMTLAGLVASVVFHVWLLATLATMNFDLQPPSMYPPLDTKFTQVDPEEEHAVEKEVEYELAPPDDRETEVRQVVNARSTGLSVNENPVMQTAPTPPPTNLDPALPGMSAFAHYDLPEGRELDDLITIQGTTGEGLVQIESALDRVTWEVANNLREHKVLVVWLIDASASLAQQRVAVGKRLHRIYGELGALEKTGQLARVDQGLLSGVVTFGEKTTFVTPEPTAEFQPVFDGVTEMKADPSGRENVFSAVDQIVHRWSKYRTANGRTIMIITLTDETGDDYDYLETALRSCQRHGVKCYVVGPAATFGRREALVPYVAPENGKTYQLPVDMGPDTFALEAVSLPFWFEGPQYEYLSAGIGPYALTRLVKETGGAYFMTNMTTMAGLAPLGTYTSDQMKNFEPDYRFGTPDAYMADLAKHPLRRAIVASAQLSLQHHPKGTPPLEFRVTPQNYLQTLSDAQKSTAETTYMLDLIMQPFQTKFEREYGKESSPRWRVAYDLALGRMLALKVRAYEYNSACAQLKVTLGSGDVASKSNHWLFRPDTQFSGGATSKKIATEAEKLLKRVLAEAPGTPWAVLAARELSHPFGFRVIQRYDPPPPPPSRAAPQIAANKTKQIRLANDAPKKKAAPAPPPRPQPPPVLPKL